MTTPQTEAPEIAQKLGIGALYLKREDLHPYGSHKGRSIPVMIDFYANQGAHDFVISSSGNGALAAIRYIQERNRQGDDLSLAVFVGKHIDEAKRKRLEREIEDPEKIEIQQTARPLQAVFRILKEGGNRVSLRQSTDDEALVGYASLASELLETPELAAVFIPASSGTAAQAIAEYFLGRECRAAVHIVQTPQNSPIAGVLAGPTDPSGQTLEENDLDPPNPSLADAIVDRVAHRREKLVEAVKKTGGAGWIATDDDIREAQGLLRGQGIEATGNGALSLAGLIRARRAGTSFPGSVVCVITGR